MLYRTRTYGELDALVADLPVSTSAPAVRAGIPRWVGVAAALAVLLALLGLLAGAARFSTEAVEGPRHAGRFGFPAGPLESHRLMIAAVPQVALFVLLVVCVVLLWLLMRSRNPRVPGSRGVR